MKVMVIRRRTLSNLSLMSTLAKGFTIRTFSSLIGVDPENTRNMVWRYVDAGLLEVGMELTTHKIRNSRNSRIKMTRTCVATTFMLTERAHQLLAERRGTYDSAVPDKRPLVNSVFSLARKQHDTTPSVR